MALTDKWLPLSCWLGSPHEVFLQTHGPSIHQRNSATVFCSDGITLQCKFPLKSYPLIRRGKRHQEGTILTRYWDSVSLSRINFYSDEHATHPGRDSPAAVNNLKDVFPGDSKLGFREGEGPTEHEKPRNCLLGEGEENRRRLDELKNDLPDVEVEDGSKEPDSRSSGPQGSLEAAVEVISWSERQRRAGICESAGYLTLWEILADYERSVMVIPGLVKTGQMWLLQQGVESSMYWHIKTCVVLDLQEFPRLGNGDEIQISDVNRDSKHFKGRWYLRPGPRSGMTILHYIVNVTPNLFFRMLFVDRIIQADLIALHQRAETNPSEGKNLLNPSYHEGNFFSNDSSVSTFGVFTEDINGTYYEIQSLTAQGVIFSIQGDCSRGISLSTSTGRDSRNLSSRSWGSTKRCLLTTFRGMKDPVDIRKLNSLYANYSFEQQLCLKSRDRKKAKETRLITTTKPPKVAGKRFRVLGLQKDFRVLEKELFDFILKYGLQGWMPMRRNLRQHKRIDLEKAITRMGGFGAVAKRLNLCQQRRPRGYWDNFQNLQNEILLFQKESGVDSNYMPTRSSLNKAGRSDVARALEKWGGVQEVAQLMGFKVRRVRLLSTAKIFSRNTSNLRDDVCIPRKPLKTSLPAKSTKWIDMK